MGKKILVVGAGLSGLSAAVHLVRKGAKLTLVNNGVNHSSIVAAGQINPLVFRRMTKSWRVDEFLPYARDFYRSLEEETRTTFFHEITIRRMFSSEQEKGLWLEKQSKEAFSDYMHPVTAEDTAYKLAKNDFGSGRLRGSAYVNTAVFLDAALKWIADRAIILNEHANYGDFDPVNFSWKGEVFDEIIFCEGYHNHKNPWFSKFPVNLTKGEVLTVVSERIQNKEALNRKCFLLPVSSNTFRLGATYVWNTDSLELTENGKNELLEKAQFLTDEELIVVDHKAGIRPTTPDRRPIIGRHPEFPKFSVFNGLGTKGYMLAPKLAQEFTDFLINGTSLNSEVSVDRFK